MSTQHPEAEGNRDGHDELPDGYTIDDVVTSRGSGSNNIHVRDPGSDTLQPACQIRGSNWETPHPSKLPFLGECQNGACFGDEVDLDHAYETYRDEDWLREQYWGEGKTIEEVAAAAGAGEQTIRKWMQRKRIATKPNPHSATMKTQTLGQYGKFSNIWVANLDLPRCQADTVDGERCSLNATSAAIYKTESEGIVTAGAYCTHHAPDDWEDKLPSDIDYTILERDAPCTAGVKRLSASTTMVEGNGTIRVSSTDELASRCGDNASIVVAPFSDAPKAVCLRHARRTWVNPLVDDE